MDRRHGLILNLGTGVIIGTAAGLLLPPKTGKETRHVVVERPGAIPAPGKKGTSSVKGAGR